MGSVALGSRSFARQRARVSRHMMFASTDSTQLRNVTDMVAELSSTVTTDTEVATGPIHRSTDLLVELQDENAGQVLSLETVPEKCQERFPEDKRASRGVAR